MGISFVVEAGLLGAGAGLGASYAYNAQNQRVWRSSTVSGTTTEVFYFCGIDGKMIQAYTPTIVAVYGLPYMELTATEQGLNFAGRLVGRSDAVHGTGVLVAVSTDGVGTARWDDSLGGVEASFFPWGEERGTVTGNDRVKWGTYWRDSESSLDYAMNRYYSNVTGRFLGADPYMANSGGPGDPTDPQSWNRYAYTRGDPVNRFDPAGLDDCAPGDFGSACDGFMPGDSGGDGGDGWGVSMWWVLGGIGGGNGGGGGGGGGKKKPDCINAFPGLQVDFVVNNYASSVALGGRGDVPSDWVLGWSALESYWGSRGIVLTNGNFIGWRGSGDLRCGPGTDNTFGCFSGFNSSLTTALFSTSNYFKYGGKSKGVTAALILSDQFSGGASVEQAFDALAHAGYTPDQGYGAGVASRDSQVLRIENCLRQDGRLP